tara:strand:+ start:133 stop:288 length:156 start_codon:yes stop_codon:yes gene_type:complete
METQAREAAIDLHRAQIQRALEKMREGHWTPSQAANHRDWHERQLRELSSQ